MGDEKNSGITYAQKGDERIDIVTTCKRSYEWNGDDYWV